MTKSYTTVVRMLRLHQTFVLCFWCLLQLHRQTLADEEALWGPTPSRENPSENKQSHYWWTPSLPKLPSLPSLPFHIPFYSSGDSLDSNEKAATLTTTTKGLTEPIDHLQDLSGSGEGSISEASEPPTTSTQGLLTSVTKIRTESLPTGTSDSPHSSIAQNHNDTLVSDSYSPTSSSIRNTLFIKSPTSTSAPEQNATHTHSPQGFTQEARPSMGATAQQSPEERTDKDKTEDFSEKKSSTIAPETTVPTALTWAVVKTTTINPALVETTLTRHSLGPVTSPMSPQTTIVTMPQDSAVSLSTEEATRLKTYPTQSEIDWGFSEARSGAMEEQLGVITTAMGIDHKLLLVSITSTTQSQKVNFPIEGGKQKLKNQ